MAVLKPLPPEWDEWVATRPPAVRTLCRAYPPNVLYRMAGPAGHRCTIVSYGEDGTVSVAVTGTFNRVLFSRRVFGVDPAGLTECDLPAPGEDLGDTAAEAGYTDADVKNILIPLVRQTLDRGDPPEDSHASRAPS